MADKQEKEKPVSNTMQVNDFGNRIYTIRGKQVMLDYELAALYGYEVRALNQQVKRNIERFPDDFMFQLTKGGGGRGEITICDFTVFQFITSIVRKVYDISFLRWSGRRAQKTPLCFY